MSRKIFHWRSPLIIWQWTNKKTLDILLKLCYNALANKWGHVPLPPGIPFAAGQYAKELPRGHVLLAVDNACGENPARVFSQ
jgi:hypothetical protein